MTTTFSFPWSVHTCRHDTRWHMLLAKKAVLVAMEGFTLYQGETID